MDWSTIIVALLALLGSLVGTYASNSKTKALVVYRIEQLEKKQEAHNKLIDRMYKAEKNLAVHSDEINEVNRRLDNLEKAGE